jgi:hypothetical protein
MYVERSKAALLGVERSGARLPSTQADRLLLSLAISFSSHFVVVIYASQCPSGNLQGGEDANKQTDMHKRERERQQSCLFGPAPVLLYIDFSFVFILVGGSGGSPW